MTEPEIKDSKNLEKATADASIGLEKRIENVFTELVEKKFAALEKRLDEKIEGILATKEVEVEHALRKGFGLDTDPVIHQSDLISAIRKAQLEVSPTEKKTPAPNPLEKTSPDGTKPEDWLSKMEKNILGGPA